MRRCLVTGCLGFSGKYLLEYLQEKKDLDLYGIDIRQDHKGGLPGKYFRVNLNNRKAVVATLKEIKPHLIFHLAGRMFGKSYEEYHRGNVKGMINLLDAVLESKGNRKNGPVIVDAGSSAEYGFSDRKSIPIQEDAPLRPKNFYGISKVVQGLLALQYHTMFGLKVIRTRTFNLIGPGQSSHFVCGSITRQIVALEKEEKKKGVLKIGNVKSIRDFVDVRDAVRAYWLLSQEGKPGEIYNVCSGRGTSILQAVNLALRFAKKELQVAHSRKLKKKEEIPIQIGNHSKISSIGWKPNIAFKISLRDMVQWLRK